MVELELASSQFKDAAGEKVNVNVKQSVVRISLVFRLRK